MKDSVAVPNMAGEYGDMYVPWPEEVVGREVWEKFKFGEMRQKRAEAAGKEGKCVAAVRVIDEYLKEIQSELPSLNGLSNKDETREKFTVCKKVFENILFVCGGLLNELSKNLDSGEKGELFIFIEEVNKFIKILERWQQAAAIEELGPKWKDEIADAEERMTACREIIFECGNYFVKVQHHIKLALVSVRNYLINNNRDAKALSASLEGNLEEVALEKKKLDEILQNQHS